MCLALCARLQEMNGKHKLSKKCMRKCFGWNFTEMMQKALIMLDPKALVKCLTITPKETDQSIIREAWGRANSYVSPA